MKLKDTAPDWRPYHSALSQCAELLDNMSDGDPIIDTPKFLAAKLVESSDHAPTGPKFPERDQSRPAEQQGMFEKFRVQRLDGSDCGGGKHYGCRYFVLDLTHDQHAPAAMHAYAGSCAVSHPQLAADIFAEFGAPTKAAEGSIAGDDRFNELVGAMLAEYFESDQHRIRLAAYIDSLIFASQVSGHPGEQS